MESIPFAHQPNELPGRNYITGLGDLTPTVFLSPAQPGKMIWGLGPVAVLPTATNTQLGQGKFSIDPLAVVLATPCLGKV